MLSALVLATVVLAALIVGGGFFAVVWLAAAVMGYLEWLAMSRTEPRRALALAGGVAVAALTLADQAGATADVRIGIAAAGLIALLVLARTATSRLNAALGFAGAAVIALVPPALRDAPEIGILGPAWMFAIVWSTDIAAYFAGRSLGGPKLMPTVSPKKTWSGALGGLLAATLAGLGLVVLARGQGWSTAAQSLPLSGVALASAAASVVSQAGDLLESALKRRYGVKDSGHSIPGHGGIMDRLDGFFAVAALVGLWLVARQALPG